MRGGGHRPGGTLLQGFSLTRAFMGLAVLALAASVFLPASQIQCNAAKRAIEEKKRLAETASWTTDLEFIGQPAPDPADL